MSLAEELELLTGNFVLPELLRLNLHRIESRAYIIAF